MKEYWVAIGVGENELIKAPFSTKEAAKNMVAYFKSELRESFYCLVKEPKRVAIPVGRKVTSKVASKVQEVVLSAAQRGTVNSYYYVDKNTWLSSSFGHELNVMYYDSCLFSISIGRGDGVIQDVTCIFHSNYLTWSTLTRMQSACALLPYRVGFRIINGEPWLVGNFKQVKVPVNKPFSLMRYVKVLFNIL